MENTIFSHRLYKDEFNAEFVYQLEKGNIEGLTATDESSEKVLVIVGKLADLEKLGHIMYCNDEAKIKATFPSFVTEQEFKDEQREVAERLYNTMLTEMAKLATKSLNVRHRSSQEYRIMYDAYCKMRELYY
jgi:hypothetical protein